MKTVWRGEAIGEPRVYERPRRQIGSGGCGLPWYRPIRGPTPGASRGTSRRSPRSSSRRGHDVRMLTPFDPPTAAARGCTAASGRSRASWRRTSSRSGAPSACPPTAPISNLALSPAAVFRLREELRGGDYDVVHVHEPIVPRDQLGRGRRRARAARRHLPHVLDQPPDQQPRQPRRRDAGASTACTCGSRVSRPRRGPASASSAAATA